MHEQMLHNLQVFMAECEEANAKSGVPMYHSWSEYTKNASQARIIHDYVSGGLILGFNVLAGVALEHNQHYPVGAYDASVQVLLILAVLGALVIIKRISDFRHKPERGLSAPLS